MRRSLWIIFALVFGAVAAPKAQANGVDYNFALSGAGITSSGNITVMTTGTPGVDEITDITGSFSTTNNGGFSGSISGLNPGSYDASNPTGNSLTHYDNLFYASSSVISCYGTTSSVLLDYCGLDFLVSGGYEVNVGGVGGGYALLDGLAGGSTYLDFFAPVTFAVSTPEPSSIALLSIALLAMTIVARKRIVQGLHQAN